MEQQDLKQRLAEVLTREAGPALGMDGTRLEVLEVDGKIARIRLGGACGTCPSSIMAVVTMLEELVRRHVPQIRYVEAVP